LHDHVITRFASYKFGLKLVTWVDEKG
jgi:hypothetical protein